jgi:hypothetical protein
MLQEIIYKWGLLYDQHDVASRWFIRAESLDTDLFAVAYYHLDDTHPGRFYETNSEELLGILLEEIRESLYDKCVVDKNAYLQHQRDLEHVNISNFM